MTEKQYLLGTDEQQQWMREYTFAPRGNGFKEPGVLGMDAKEFSAFNVAKSFYQVHPEVFNLKLVAEKTGVAESEIAARLKRMIDRRLIMFVKNSSVSALGFGLYYWIVKMKKDCPPQAKAQLAEWIQNKDEICTGYLTEGDFDFFCGNHMRVLDNLLCGVIEPIRRNRWVESIHLCPIRRDVRESHVNLWDAPKADYRRYLWSDAQKTNFLNSQNEMDATDFAIIDILNNVTSIEDFFDYEVLGQLSGLDPAAMKKDLGWIVDHQRYVVPMFYFNYQALGLNMHCYLIRLFQNVTSCRKEQIVDELSQYPEFNNIFEFSDGIYDILVSAYAQLTDLDALRTMLDGYAEIEEVWEADSPRQFRRWTARLDKDADMWEECIFTDDFLRDRTSWPIEPAGEWQEKGGEER